MILGMSLASFTLLHVVISLLGIASGAVAVLAMAGGRNLSGWIAFFLLTTTLTSATGFLFPSPDIKPSHVFGVLSLVVLAVAFVALYGCRLKGHWRWIFVVTAVLADYLNSFVGVVQAFVKQPFFNHLAPTQTEPPFLVAQAVLLAVFVVVGILAVRRFRPVLAPR